jgi:hypothetical protein
MFVLRVWSRRASVRVACPKAPTFRIDAAEKVDNSFRRLQRGYVGAGLAGLRKIKKTHARESRQNL